MIDFSFVTTRLCTGGGSILQRADVDKLQAAGITAVIDCQMVQDDSKLLENRYEQYLFNGVEDDGKPKPVSWFQASLEFALQRFIEPNQKVYCHCAAGVNRGPSTAYAIMLALGWYDFEASAQIRINRPVTIAGLRYQADADAAVKALGYV